MAYGHSSGLLPWEAPVMIAEKHRLFFSSQLFSFEVCTMLSQLQVDKQSTAEGLCKAVEHLQQQ